MKVARERMEGEEELEGNQTDSVAVDIDSGRQEAEELVEQRFYPFLRKSPPWDVYEVIKTVVMTIFVLPVRCLFLAIFGIILYAVSAVALASVEDFEAYCFQPLPMMTKIMLMTIAPLIRVLLFCCFGVFKIKRTVVNDDVPAHVIIANHTGYLDILVLLATYNGAFVAKEGIMKMRFVGTVAKALQCLFVKEGQALTERLSKRVSTTYECHESKAMPGGCPGCGSCLSKLIIFPEGTTTNGYGMCAFRTGVFVSQKPVKPVAIRFPYRHFNVSWETIPLKEHFWRTTTQFVNHVELIELPAVVPTDADKEDPKKFAQTAQEAINKALDLPVYALQRKHKFVYHKYFLGRISAEEALAEADSLTKDDPLLRGVEARQELSGSLCP